MRPDVSMFQALPGGPAAAVPYWNTSYTHVDIGDYEVGNVTSAPDGTNRDTLYVMDLNVTSAPEPASLAVWGVGAAVLAFGARRWRKRRSGEDC